MVKPILQACICSVCNKNLTDMSELKRNDHLNKCRNNMSKNKENLPNIYNVEEIKNNVLNNSVTIINKFSNSLYKTSEKDFNSMISYQGHVRQCHNSENHEDSDIEIIENFCSQPSNLNQIMEDSNDQKEIKEIHNLYERRKSQLKKEYEEKMMEIERQYKLAIEKLEEEKKAKIEELNNRMNFSLKSSNIDDRKRKKPLEHIPCSKKICEYNETEPKTKIQGTTHKSNSKLQNFNILDNFGISTNHNEILDSCNNSDDDLLVPVLNIKRKSKSNSIINNNKNEKENSQKENVTNVQIVTSKDFEKYTIDELKIMAKRYGLKYKSKKFVIEQLVAIKNYENANNPNIQRNNGCNIEKSDSEDKCIIYSISEFIKSNKYLYNKVLHYEPISIEETQKLLKENNIKVSKVKLRSYLKLQGINYNV